MPDTESYPDSERERRNGDDYILVRLSRDVGHWWNHRIGRVAQAVTVLSAVATLGGGLFGAVFTAGMFARDFEGIPAEVRQLETRMDHYRDTTNSLSRRLGNAETSIDTLREQVADVSSDMASMRAMIGQLRRLAVANNCWIRVAAGQESRFNCSSRPD